MKFLGKNFYCASSKGKLETHVSDLAVLLDEHPGRDVPDTAGPAAVPELQQAGTDDKVPAYLCQVDGELLQAAGAVLGPLRPPLALIVLLTTQNKWKLKRTTFLMQKDGMSI